MVNKREQKGRSVIARAVNLKNAIRLAANPYRTPRRGRRPRRPMHAKASSFTVPRQIRSCLRSAVGRVACARLLPNAESHRRATQVAPIANLSRCECAVRRQMIPSGLRGRFTKRSPATTGFTIAASGCSVHFGVQMKKIT